MNRGTYEQLYTEPRKHAEYLVRVFRSPLYLFVDGRPVLGVYLLHDVPRQYMQALRTWIYALGGWNVFVVQVAMNFGGNEQPYAQTHNSDAMLEFYPNLFWTNEVRKPETCEVGSVQIHAHTPTLQPHSQVDLPVWRGGFTGS